MIEILNNKIKFLSGFNFVLCFIYFYLPNYLKGAMSFFHLLHIVIDPIIFLSSILNKKIFNYGALALASVAFGADVLALIFNYISISRCLLELSSECLNRIFETNVLWALISIVFTATGFVLIQLLYRKTGMDDDTLYTVIDYASSARYLHLFLWTNDGIGFAVEGATIITILHSVLNPLCIWITYRNENISRGIRFMSVIFFIVLIIDTLGFVLHNVMINDIYFGTQNLFAIQYIATDVILIYYYINIKK